MSSQTSLPFVVLIATIAAIGGFLFGFDSGVINGTVAALAEAFHSDSVGTGFSVASLLLGCAAGAFAAGPTADRLGRRGAMLVTAVFFAVSAGGSGIAASATEFVVYRLVGGVAVGAASVLAPAYIAEVAPAHLRGRLASLQQLAIVLGIVAAFSSNYSIAALAGGAQAPFWFGYPAWRWMFWMEVFPSLAFLIGTLFIPESPRFLVAVGKKTEALEVFRRVAGSDAERLVESVESTLGNHRPSVRDVFVPGTKRFYPLVWVGIGLSVLQQFVGINVVFYYGEVLWRAAGFSEEEALLVNLLSGLVNVASTIVAMVFIDRIGRKPLLLGGSIGMAASLGGLALCFAGATVNPSGQPVLGDSLALTALVLANLYVFAFGVSWGPCVWVLLGEMFPNRYRAAGLSVSAGIQWIANFAVTMTFPVFLAEFGLPLSYAIYTFFAVLSIGFVVRAVTETNGRTLEQMGT